MKRVEFFVGDRVTMSNRAIRAGFQGRLERRDGVIEREPRDPEMVCVRRDGREQAEYFHRDFWVLVARAK